jgi:hypothetical protein
MRDMRFCILARDMQICIGFLASNLNVELYKADVSSSLNSSCEMLLF